MLQERSDCYIDCHLLLACNYDNNLAHASVVWTVSSMELERMMHITLAVSNSLHKHIAAVSSICVS